MSCCPRDLCRRLSSRLGCRIGTLRDLDDLGQRVPSRPLRRSGLPCLSGDFDDSETACKWEYANCRTEFSTKLFAGHCNRGSQSKNSALLSIVYSAVRFTCRGALDFTISDSWRNFSCPEYDRGPCRGWIRWFNRTKTCPESQTHRETTHRVGSWNDRARCLRRDLEMSIRP